MPSSSITNQIPKLVVIGHVDHGKSSFIGRLIHDLGETTDSQNKEIMKISKKRGLEFEPAFFLDALQSERDQGVTIDTTQIFFKTKKRNYVFIDSPGHKEFIKNMITGASSADLAFLILDAQEGIKEQTTKHAYLLKLLGIKNVVSLVNKMDIIKYCEETFNNLKNDLDTFLSKIGIHSIYTIPISAKTGDNVYLRSKKMKWYKGKICVDAIDDFEIKTQTNSSDLRLPVQDIYKINNKRIIVGRVESGSLMVNDELLFLPSNEKVKIKSFEGWPRSKKIYNQGECIGLTLKDQIFVDRGNLICHPKNPPKLMNTFECSLFWIGEKNLKEKQKLTMKINTGEYNITVEKIIKIIDTNNLEKKQKLDVVKKNEVCELILHSPQLIPMDDFTENQNTGRFCLESREGIVGGGIVNVQNFPDQLNLEKENSSNIVPIDFSVKEADRTSKLNHRPGIIWLTGLSGSGKSTIAKEVEKKLFLKNYNVFVLDGDNLRLGLNRGLNFSPEDRKENIRRTSEVAKLFTYAGFIVIVSLISPYRSERKKARDLRPEVFREIFINASVKECIKRDVKGLYSKAQKGEISDFTGINSPYEEPKKPDLIINTEKAKPEDSVNELVKYITKEFGIIK